MQKNNPIKKPRKVSQLAALSRPFEFSDFGTLCDNEFWRFLQNSNKIGAVLLPGDNQDQAIQFAAPGPRPVNSETPDVRTMLNIKQINPLGLRRYEANSPTGTNYVAKRFLQFKMNGQAPSHVAFFSPTKDKVFWGNIDTTPVFDKNKTNDPEALQVYNKTKAGASLSIKRADIPKRETATRSPSQNAIMGRSAVEALHTFLNNNKDKLSNSIVSRIQRSIDAPLYNQFYSNYRSEWLHAFGWGLTPMNKDPQTKHNLGSAPKWSNTEMMLLERIAKWFSLNKTNAKVKIKPKFSMLLNSDIIKHIDFSVKIKWNQNKLVLSQSIDTLLQYPLFRKASDIAIATYLFDKLIRNEQGTKYPIICPANQASQELTSLHPTRTLVVLPPPNLKRKREQANL